jgi:hypothetical protein
MPDVSGKTLKRMEERVSELVAGFGHYSDIFDQSNLFTGPSLYFHFKTLNLLRSQQTVIETIANDDFFESLYATLASWGLHRMGPGNTKLVELEELKGSVRKQNKRIQEIAKLSIWKLDELDVHHVADLLWEIIAQLRVGIGETKIVAGSKALHHVLPDLVPPIDREYTLRFFYNHTTLNRGDEKPFREMYPWFHYIARSCLEDIQSRLGVRMNTSVTKVIDNAIVGYGLKHLKKRKQKVR